MELRHTGIKVSLIEPGPIRTRFTDNVNQTQRDKPVENPGIAARFTRDPDAVVAKVRHAFASDKPSCAILLRWSPGGDGAETHIAGPDAG